MRHLPRRILAWFLVTAGGAAHAAPASLRCDVLPAQPRLGHPLQWSIRAANLPGIPMLQAARLGADWLLQGQTAQRSASGPARSLQTLELTLYPMSAGTLRLPAVRAGALSCPPRTVRIAESPPGQPAQYIAAHIENPNPVVGQAVRVDLDIGAGGALDWQPVRAGSDEGVIRPLSTLSTAVDAGGVRMAAQRQSWSFTPLRPGDSTIRFGLLRATPFGQLLVYPVTPLQVRVQALPAYWPVDAAIGQARLRIEPAPQHLELGATGVLRATLEGVQIGRAALLRSLEQASATHRGLRMYAPRLRLDPDSAHTLTPVWHIELAFRVTAGGYRAYPKLRIPYYDPRLGAPRLAVADWGPLRVHDPRPLRMLEAVGLVGALVLLLALARVCVGAIGVRLCRRRWQRIAHRGDSRALLRAWRRDLARGAPEAQTLRSWARSLRCGSRPVLHQELDALIRAEEQGRYASAAPRAQLDACAGKGRLPDVLG